MRNILRPRLSRDLTVIAIVVVAGMLLARLVWRDITFWGDNAESFWPLWHMWGTAIRSGEIFLFQPEGWSGANVVGESAYQVFNPVTALFAVLISFFDNIALAGFLVVIASLTLFGWGVYGVARAYGAENLPALLVGAAAPFAGFTLFYEAGNWISGLLSALWVAHFWWSSKIFADRKSGPLIPFLLGALAATVGSPYAAVGIVVTLAAVGVELLVRHDLRRFWQYVATGVAVGAIVVLTYVPLLFALPHTERSGGGLFATNDNYLSPTLSDLAAASAPTYLPRMDAWYATHDLVPSTYLAWFVLPLLPWLRFGVLRSWRSFLSIYVATGIYMIMLLGPQNFWLFRWPIRFVEYAYIGVFAMFAVVLTQGLSTETNRKRKMVLSGAIVVFGGYASWSSTPSNLRHQVATALVMVAFVALLWAWRRWSFAGLTVVALVATLGFAGLQSQLFAWSKQSVTAAADQEIPHRLSAITDASTNISGRVMQIAHLEAQIGNGAVADGKLVFANLRAAAEQSSVTRYTGINFANFSIPLDMDYRGSFRDLFELSTLFEPVSTDITAPLVDVMGVDTLVIAQNREDIATLTSSATGWHVVEEDDVRVILQRDVPLDHPAISATSDITLAATSDKGDHLTIDVEQSNGGFIVVDRLAWPGYSAHMDGVEMPVGETDYGLLTVNVPVGAKGTIEIDYNVPGLVPTMIGALAAALAVLVAQILGYRQRRGLRDNGSASAHETPAPDRL